ncbi:MAG TPA: acetate kinase [Gemmatimonadales bacterium]|nr:acetate kinase [Gemmatimonadales bacterium]
MNILIINCGSSSVKFQLLRVEPDRPGGDRSRRLAGGLIERIGPHAIVTMRREDQPELRAGKELPDHEAAVRHALELVESIGQPVDAVGHRVVHGGDRYIDPTLIDQRVIEDLQAIEPLAPLHNAPALAGIRAAHALLGTQMPMVAVFDTAFHARMPDRARYYAIPPDIARTHGIRRYGFHGISFGYLLTRFCGLTQTPQDQATLVALHLGNGSSAAAIKNGLCVDTSMGLTPLEGLVMGTRSGDIDPAVIPLLHRKAGCSPEEVERILNERSGLLGLSGRSHDMRDLLEHEVTDPGARLAVEMYCYRVKKCLGSYLAALGGAGALVFSGGIGENAPEIRARICAEMEWCGLALDPWKNHRIVGHEGEIGAAGSALRVLVIPTDEERVIAAETASVIGGEPTRRS